MINLYVVKHTHRHGTSVGLLRSDHEPDGDEIAKAMRWQVDPQHDDVEAICFEADAIITLPPSRPSQS